MPDEFDQYKRSAAAAGGDEFDQYKRKAAPPEPSMLQLLAHPIDNLGAIGRKVARDLPEIPGYLAEHSYPGRIARLGSHVYSGQKIPGEAEGIATDAIKDFAAGSTPELLGESEAVAPRPIARPGPTGPESLRGIPGGAKSASLAEIPRVETPISQARVLAGPEEGVREPYTPEGSQMKSRLAELHEAPAEEAPAADTGEGSQIKTRLGELNQPEKPAAALARLPMTSAKPVSQTGEALGTIPSKTAAAPVGRIAPATPKAIGEELNQSLGAQPLKPNVPLREQMKIARPEPVSQAKAESSVIQSHSYDPDARELQVTTKSNPRITYVYGDVDADQAKILENASSKGKAWAEFKKGGSPLVAKIVDGQRIPVRPIIAPKDISAADVRVARPNEDLTPLLKQSVARARQAKPLQ